MELRVLKYFLAVAQEGNITSAAMRLHIGQPTLSRQIKELEREIGQQLFERQSHGVRLTEEGRILRAYAEQMTEIAQKAEDDFRAMKNKPLGDVYIGGAETDLFRIVATILKKVHEHQPGMRLHYTAGNFANIASKIDRGLLDFAILSQPANVGKYEIMPFPSSEKWVLYLRRDNPLAQKKILTKKDLLHEPLILSEQVALNRTEENNVAKWFGNDFASLNVVATFNLSYSGSILVQEGIGSMLTWDKLIQPTEENGLCTRPLDPPLSSWLALAWRKNELLSRAAKYFLDVAEEVVRDWQ